MNEVNLPSTLQIQNNRIKTESGKSCLSQKACINDAIRIWNQLPSVVTDCKTLSQLKNTTKTYVKTLPI